MHSVPAANDAVVLPSSMAQWHINLLPSLHESNFYNPMSAQQVFQRTMIGNVGSINVLRAQTKFLSALTQPQASDDVFGPTVAKFSSPVRKGKCSNAPDSPPQEVQEKMEARCKEYFGKYDHCRNASVDSVYSNADGGGCGTATVGLNTPTKSSATNTERVQARAIRPDSFRTTHTAPFITKNIEAAEDISKEASKAIHTCVSNFSVPGGHKAIKANSSEASRTETPKVIRAEACDATSAETSKLGEQVTSRAEQSYSLPPLRGVARVNATHSPLMQSIQNRLREQAMESKAQAGKQMAMMAMIEEQKAMMEGIHQIQMNDAQQLGSRILTLESQMGHVQQFQQGLQAVVENQASSPLFGQLLAEAIRSQSNTPMAGQSYQFPSLPRRTPNAQTYQQAPVSQHGQYSEPNKKGQTTNSNYAQVMSYGEPAKRSMSAAQQPSSKVYCNDFTPKNYPHKTPQGLGVDVPRTFQNAIVQPQSGSGMKLLATPPMFTPHGTNAATGSKSATPVSATIGSSGQRGYKEVFSTAFMNLEATVRANFVVSVSTDPDNEDWKRFSAQARAHIGNLKHIAKILEADNTRLYLYIGVVARWVVDFLYNIPAIDNFGGQLVGAELSDLFRQELWMKSTPLRANDYLYRKELGEKRARAASSITKMPGFWSWAQSYARKVTEDFFKQFSFLIPPQRRAKAFADFEKVFHEHIKIVARVRVDPAYLDINFKNGGVRWDYQQMVHKNPELSGQSLNQVSTDWVTLICLAPWVLKKTFGSDNTIAIETVTLPEVYLGPRSHYLK